MDKREKLKMDYMDKDFAKILKNNAQSLRHELLPLGTDCFRVYDRNLSRYPVTVDIYGKYAKVTDYGDTPLEDPVLESCLDICTRMLYLDRDHVIYSHRAHRTEREQHEKTDAPAVRTTVREDGLSFTVDLTTYVDTGLFLDHSRTRKLIRERSANAEVLNLFSYTGSFSVYAAAGLASSVTSVDLSATYTRWAEENLQANGYSGEMYRCICEDASRFVDRAIEKGLKYDIIIFDPPSFSNSRKMDGDFDVSRDYVAWVKRLFMILKKTGIILFSTNLGSFQMDKRKLRGLSIKEITGLVMAPGFVKGRAGTVRSWMMAFDDDSLSLDWSEPEKKSVKGSDEKKYSDRRREGGERRSYERRDDRREGRRDDRRERDNRERRYSDRPQRSERTDRPYRSYDRDDRYERPERSDRSYRPRREERDFEDRPYRRREDRQDRPYRSERRYDDRPSYDRPSYDRPPRSDHYRSKSYDRDDRAPRFNRDERPERRERTDRPERSFRSERSERSPYDRPDRPSRGKSKKPYGYDSFKPARSRDDSSDFFWNDEDLDSKK